MQAPTPSSETDWVPLVQAASAARSRARAPFSSFHVGAALLAGDGAVYSGCNIEASNYSLTCCAERVALFKALSEGASRFSAIAIVSDATAFTPPCGSCRQLLWEYCGDIPVVLAKPSGEQRLFWLRELLPEPFGTEFFRRHS